MGEIDPKLTGEELYRASHPHLAVLGRVPGGSGQFGDLRRHPDNERIPGIAIVRLESGLFFANADAIRLAIRAAAAAPGTRAVILDAETIPFVDVTAAHMLGQLAGDLEREGVRLVLARDVGQVRDVLGVADRDEPPILGYPTVHDAIEALR